LQTQLPALHVDAPTQALAAFCHSPMALQNWGVVETHRVGMEFGAHALQAPWLQTVPWQLAHDEPHCVASLSLTHIEPQRWKPARQLIEHA
jgi:hypothetical protein